jgi:cytochrome b561
MASVLITSDQTFWCLTGMQNLSELVSRTVGALRVFCKTIAERTFAKLSLRNTASNWGTPAKVFHWLVVFLIITQWAIAEYAEGQPLARKIAPLALHKSIGVTILAITILRLVWRLATTQPVSTLKAWEHLLAKISHTLLYGLVLALPITGWLMSSARSFPVSWFGKFQLPDLVAPNHILFQQMQNLHRTLFMVLVAVAFLHIAGALKHHFIDRSDVLLRMLPFANSDRASRR